jgi:hypothetical protein
MSDLRQDLLQDFFIHFQLHTFLIILRFHFPAIQDWQPKPLILIGGQYLLAQQ